MKRLLFFGMIALLLAACGKDKFQTVPQIEITSFGPDEVVKGQLIKLTADVTDQEGDLQDSLYVVRKRYNGSTILGSADTTRYFLRPLGAPRKQKIEVQVLFLYGELAPEIAPIQNLETFADRDYTIGLVVIDNAGHRSEYVESKRIVLKKL
jgi:pimeloyl-ACP methyl ester carboxylesterase